MGVIGAGTFRAGVWGMVVGGVMIGLMLGSCDSSRGVSGAIHPSEIAFDPASLLVPDEGGRRLRGQVIYMPIYSSIPYQVASQYELSAFLAFHNTDLDRPIRITKVVYFDTGGKVVKNFLASDQVLHPLATAVFAIPTQDDSGPGANFLVEWMADQAVSEPLCEAVMKDLSGNRGISFLSTGRVIRELK